MRPRKNLLELLSAGARDEIISNLQKLSTDPRLSEDMQREAVRCSRAIALMQRRTGSTVH